MMFELLISVAKTSLIALLICVAGVIVANYLAVQRFRKKMPRMPIAPARNLLFGHWGDISYKRGTFDILTRNHRKLGKTYAVFLGQRVSFSTVDLDFIKRMVLDEGNINRFFPETPIHEFEQDSIIKVPDSQWKRIRRVYASALSEHKIKSTSVQDEIASVRERYLDSLEWRMGEKAEIEVNLDDLSCRWSFDQALTSLLKQPNLIDYKANQDRWVHMVESGLGSIVNPIIAIGVAFEFMHKIADWLAMRLHITGKYRTILEDLITQQAVLNSKARAEAKADALERGDPNFDFGKVDEYLMKDGAHFRRNAADSIIDKLENGMLTKREYLHSTAFLFLAAGKTTADAVTALIFYLAKHPEVQEKLRKAVITEGLKCEYLTWAVNEALRLIPPVEGSCARVLTSDLYTSDGMLLPKGSRVTVATHVVHRLKEYWGQDADEFRPERWAQAKSFHPCQYIAFGLGNRNCVGEKYALESIKTLLCALLHRYKFAPSDKSTEMKVDRSLLYIAIIFEKPTYVKFSPLNKANQSVVNSDSC